ncbi:hypothetical protein MKQ70_22725 [Chitinophaga sedimenti]|uniref:hypothetical protein n=1 Tax=Chitinophaga sedimenti TaxID=2033606 RepID=UPI002004B17D|nr:hypothetical protein [Chitinophaga sedimenti]MCK7557667.1 hypothetical protein [Chitinophaga sedimenti]
MELDKTTYLDLSIFNRDEEFSLLHKLDFTSTAGGREYLRSLFANPLKDLKAIGERQAMLKFILEQDTQWPTQISNGTIVVIENYLNAEIDPISSNAGLGLVVSATVMKTIYAPDFGFVRFSFTQLLNLLRGFKHWPTCITKTLRPLCYASW